MIAMEIDGLSKRFHLNQNEKGFFWAFRDVSLAVLRGERVGIIGPNGSGKSTLLRVLARIISPTEGTARLRGRVGTIINIGSGFHPELTGRENTFFSGSLLGMDIAGIKKQFDRIVSFAEVEKFIDTPVKYYSSGMYLRLAFSIAAHLNVDIFLLDEVISVGDEVFQKRCQEKLLELSLQGCTLVTVSHDLARLQQLCNRVVLMEQGRIIKESMHVHEMLQTYKNVV